MFDHYPSWLFAYSLEITYSLWFTSAWRNIIRDKGNITSLSYKYLFFKVQHWTFRLTCRAMLNPSVSPLQKKKNVFVFAFCTMFQTFLYMELDITRWIHKMLVIDRVVKELQRCDKKEIFDRFWLDSAAWGHPNVSDLFMVPSTRN